MNTETETILNMPKPEKNGFIKTLNDMGYMTSHLDIDAATLIRTSKLQCLQPGEPVCQTEKETVTH